MASHLMTNDLKQANRRIGFLADRMALLLVICKSRSQDWNPWFRDAMYDAEDSMGVEIREWPEYTTAKDIIRNMLRKFDNEQINLQERQKGQVESDDKGS